MDASGSDSTTLSYTFTEGGTYYVRVCTDKSSAIDVGIINESDEGNNCSSELTVNVTAD